MADLELFSRLFANREEPAGDRVNMCFKLNTIKVVLKALTPEEIETIRPCFGKLLDVYSKHVFSGKLAHFLLTRQLNVVSGQNSKKFPCTCFIPLLSRLYSI
ncbi:predicted protein [Arabidopsis lyrata subsp. lyrata]|uniref:Predicted protein n=1 Tax=Arabidopsis lyrata subsp. lyrata TaxID=81972 RepID=D7LDR7_ARALL|nr:predicted protein [Arabidopsis lyrata subsp. lyrata]EFH57935.1 predicted protein [Arabidopsis lyrata subsp. lyrata]